jgi:hypothetical protein
MPVTVLFRLGSEKHKVYKVASFVVTEDADHDI